MVFLLRCLLTCALCICFIAAPAQKKKDIRRYGVKTISSTKTIGTKTVKDEKLTYDSNGLLIEQVVYDEEGVFVRTTRFKYNLDEEVTEEADYDAVNALVEKRSMRYNYLSQKTEERVTDRLGKQIRRITYAYDGKGLRKEKKTYDANNVLVITKKISYTYR